MSRQQQMMVGTWPESLLLQSVIRRETQGLDISVKKKKKKKQQQMETASACSRRS